MRTLQKLLWTTVAAVPALMAAGPSFNCDFRDGVSPAPSTLYILCENATLLASTDQGASWMSYSTGKERSLLAIAFLDAKRGLIAGDNGVLLASNDGGTHWQPLNANTSRALRSISVVGESVWIAGDGGIILHSADGGRTWKAQASPITLGLEAIDFVDAQHGWAVGWIGSILRTTDGGAKWEQVKTDAASWSLSSVTFRDLNHGWVVGFDGQILSTQDGGVTWQKQTSPSQSWLTSIRFDRSGRGWITTREGFLSTTDGGKTWQAEAAPDGSFPNRLVDVNGAAWAIGSIGLLRRGDRDQKWSVLGSLVPASAGAPASGQTGK